MIKMSRDFYEASLTSTVPFILQYFGAAPLVYGLSKSTRP